MWYAVLQKEISWYSTLLEKHIPVQAGRVYKVEKDSPNFVRAVNVHNPADVLHFSKQEAKVLFTRPTKDLDSAMEESFMVCEREYC